uniref:Uncharacterized protein n=1 Tax=Tanacetum cinerariifolium TaxID=118510 RepID=A0A699IKB6_TANCI|nr:hypothetical protein [Tanacetum cinerariifolium]
MTIFDLFRQDVVVKDVISQAARDAIPPVRTSYLTTEEVLKAHLDGESVKEMNLGTLVDILDLKVSLPTLDDQVLKVEDLLSSSVERMVGYGFRPCCEDKKCGHVVF